MGMRIARSIGVALLIALWLPASTAGARPAETYRTRVITLTALDAERAITLHERLLGPRGDSRIAVAKGGRKLVVRDTPERLARFARLLALLDVPGEPGARLYLRPVRHLGPSELAALLAEILPESERITLVPDERTGQLIVQTTWARYRQLDRLARRLDVPAGGAERGVRTLPAPDRSANKEKLP